MLARSKDIGEYFFKLCLTELYYSAMLSEFICSLGWLLTNNLTKPHPDGYYRYWAWSQLLLLECAGFNFFLLEWAGCKPASAGCCQITEPFGPHPLPLAQLVQPHDKRSILANISHIFTLVLFWVIYHIPVYQVWPKYQEGWEEALMIWESRTFLGNP